MAFLGKENLHQNTIVIRVCVYKTTVIRMQMTAIL